MPFEVQIFPDANAGLKAELAMLDTVASGHPPSAFLWRARQPALVAPRPFSREPGYAEACVASGRRGWPVTLRQSGGGITPQGPGVVNLALSFRNQRPGQRSIPAAYGAICDPLKYAAAALGISCDIGEVSGSFCDGEYNLQSGGRKFVGTAQRWRKGAALCHALILTDATLGPIVEKVAELSADLGRQDRFRVNSHTSLKMLTDGAADAENRFLEALSEVLKSTGYAPFYPESPT